MKNSLDNSLEKCIINFFPSLKFTIAFENACADDYVTEKFYEPLLAGSVPVYLGAPNIDKFSPGADSFLNINNFASPKELAERINELYNDQSQYDSLMAWKDRPLPQEFAQLIETQKVHPFIRLIEKVRELKRPTATAGL